MQHITISIDRKSTRMLQKLVLFLFVTYATSSHYRGGSVSWDIRQSDYINDSSTVPVRVHQRHSWRRSAAPLFWNQSLCTQDTINNGTAYLGESSLVCGSKDCYESISYLYQSITTEVLCTDFSAEYDYASGEKYTILQLPINKRFTYSFVSCCWINLLPDNSTPSWALNVVINTNPRVNGRFNSAPNSAMNPIVKLELGQIHVINIPMADIDGDRLSCRWGVNDGESGGIFQPKGNLQPNACQLTYNATVIGYEGIAIIIEDFDSNDQVLSSIPLQFLIETVSTSIITPDAGMESNASVPLSLPACPYAPVYDGVWGPSACIGVASNNSTEIRIIVEVPCENSSTIIQDILTVSPTGMSKSPITQDSQNNNKYIMNLEWTPDTDQYGIHQLCVTPVDNSSRSGQTVCFNLLVDVRSPQFVAQSMSPTGVVLSNQSTWTIATDVDIVPPTDPTISAVFYKRDRSETNDDSEVIQISMSTAFYESRQITFDTGNITWETGQEYYILLNAGVATINQSCGIQSAPITDTEFWTFSIAAEPTTAKVTSTTTIATTSEEITTASPNQPIPVSSDQPTTTTAEDITTTSTLDDTTTTTSPEDITTTTTPEDTTTKTIAEDATTIATPEDTTTETIAVDTTTIATPEDTTTETTPEDAATTSTTPEHTTTKTIAEDTTTIATPEDTTTETTPADAATTSTTPEDTTTETIAEDTTTIATPEDTTTETTPEDAATTSTTPEHTTTETIAEDTTTIATPEDTTTETIAEDTTTIATPEDTTTETTPEDAATTSTTPEDTTTKFTPEDITTTTTTQDTTPKRPPRDTTITTVTSVKTTTSIPEYITTTTLSSNPVCSEWLLFGTIKNITTSENQRNYSFCFYVNTTFADVTVSVNTWTPCATWKISGTADPLIDFYNITNDPILLAQNDDGNSIPEFNCYAAVISCRLFLGNYQIVVRHPKCNYGRFEVRLSAERSNQYK